MKKLATGGGGEIYLARAMKSFLKEKTGSFLSRSWNNDHVIILSELLPYNRLH
jgi:hypothetical protein